MGLKEMNKTLLKSISSAMVNMAMIATPLSAASATSAYYSARRLNYGKNNSSLVEESLKGLNAESSKNNRKIEREHVDVDALTGNTELKIRKSIALKELVIVDCSIKNYNLYSKLIRPGVEVVNINSGTNGYNELMSILHQHKDLEAVHLFAHNKENKVKLGDNYFEIKDLQTNIQSLNNYNGFINQQGSFLIYDSKIETEKPLTIVSGSHQKMTTDKATSGVSNLKIKQGDITATPAPGSIALVDMSTQYVIRTRPADAKDAGNVNGGPTADASWYTNDKAFVLIADGASGGIGMEYGSAYANDLGATSNNESRVRLSFEGDLVFDLGGSNYGNFYMRNYSGGARTFTFTSDLGVMGTGTVTNNGSWRTNFTGNYTGIKYIDITADANFKIRFTTITVRNIGGAPNNAPTDISLNSAAIGQSTTGVNATVGTLSTTDADVGDSHTYSLVSGTGDTDNGSFNIDGNTLRTNGILTAGSYSVRINTNDGTDDYSEAFTITVTDDIAPMFENSSPNASSISQTGFTLGTDIDEAGTIYYVVLNDGATAPSSAQVIAGTDGNNAAGLSSGSQAVSAGGFAHDFNITGLMAGSAYDVYVVAQDDEGSPNVQASSTLLEVTTTSTLTWDGSTDNNWTIADNWTPATVPGSGTDITIPNSLTNYPTANSAVTVNTVSIASGATLIVNSTFTGTVTYNRNLGTTNWYLVSSPVSGQTFDDSYVSANDIDANGSNRAIATYNTTSDSWSYLQSAGLLASTNGIGYSFKRGTSAGDVSFTGTLNTSDVTITMAIGGNGAFNLLGNPYTSYMNSGTLLVENSPNLVSQTLWLWNQGMNMYETKVTADSFMLAPAQGFFVSAANTNDFIFKESNQAHSASDTFQRNKSTRPEIHLLMSDGTNDRFTKIYYIAGTTTGFDNGYDGETFGGQANSIDVFSHLVSDSQGKNFQIQSLPDSNFENMIVPVGVRSPAGSVTFTVDDFNLPSGYKVFLEDKETGNFIRLDEDNSNYKVTFDNPVEGIGRFFLHLTTNALSTGSVDLTNISAYLSDKRNLRITGIQGGTTQVRLFNILGKQLVNTSFKASGVNDVTLPSLQQGVYILQLNSEEGNINKKIVIE